MNSTTDRQRAGRQISECWRRLALLALLGIAAGCARLPPRADLPPMEALPAATHGGIAERTAVAEAAHPGLSGFHLVAEGTEAYALRAFTAQAAASSL
ncbi:MAG: hypothetical protein IAF01_09515, partial [Xanthomonadaceae bacterium]|nr:hypothetical protein [Xanthomonadaceae bacterium]